MDKITIGDSVYPECLKTIQNPPKVLYIKGALKKDELLFAVVGTRLCSPYGKQAALEITAGLVDAGLTIVSGLAPGIDTFAHKAAVEKGRRTIAVLGTSLDEESIYPKENIPLARKIVETGGCLISEYPPGTRASRFSFPQRNRIIAGLSKGVLVIEAKEKSGSLITANYAFSQTRKVFALPGSIYSLNSRGANSLIKKGAKLVDSARDILQELGLSEKERKIVSTNYAGTRTEEILIMEALKEGPLHIDKIIERTKLAANEAAGLITVLEIEGKINNLGANTFALAKRLWN